MYMNTKVIIGLIIFQQLMSKKEKCKVIYINTKRSSRCLVFLIGFNSFRYVITTRQGYIAP